MESRKPGQMKIEMKYLVLVFMVAAIVIMRCQGQKCKRYGKTCKDVPSVKYKYGQCKQSGPNMRCARIGRTCRCKSTTILNFAPHFQEVKKKTFPGLEAMLNINLKLNNNDETNNNETEY